eukprot:INCI7926.1.p1 GENE.INCI7926.1~~INCI7926.1.p1  ORF type:complete len:523 (+),score=81.99 INCI7926.1:104-1672(+)
MAATAVSTGEVILYPPEDEVEVAKKEALLVLASQQELAETASESGHEENGVKFRVYCNRWHMLFLYFMLSAFNAFVWISFAPVVDYTATLYNVTTDAVNWLSLSFLVVYTPGAVLASYVLVRYGLRVCVLAGAIIMAVGCWMRYGSILFPVGQASWPLLLSGQFVVALIQPFFLNIVSKMAGEWFPEKEREIATVLASLAQIIGNAAGQVVPSVMLNCNQTVSPCPVDQIIGMDWLLLAQAAATSAIALWVIFFFRNAPPLPPTATSLARRTEREEFHQGDGGVAASFRALWAENKALLTDGNFVVLLVAFGMGLGMFNALLTLLEQIIIPVYYANASSTDPDSNAAQNDSGMFGGLAIAGGVVGALIMGVVLDLTHKFGLLLKIGLLCAVISLWVVLLTLRPDNTTVVAIAFGVLGFFMMPVLPCALSTAAEATYPVSEEASNGLLMLAGQYFGIIFIFLIQYLDTLRTNWWQAGTFNQSVFAPSSLCLGIVILACFVIILVFKEKTLRLDHERSAKAEED